MTTRIADDEETNTFWENLVDRDDLVVVDGEVFVNVEGEKYAYWYWVQFKNGGRKLMNLECHGTRPEELNEEMPDNAEFLGLDEEARAQKPTWKLTREQLHGGTKLPAALKPSNTSTISSSISF